MFDTITLRHSQSGGPLTSGEVAEALLFYQNVRILFDFTSLGKLASSMGAPSLLEILARPGVSGAFIEDGVWATMSTDHGGFRTYDLAVPNFAIDQQTRKAIRDRTDILALILKTQSGYDDLSARKFAKQLRSVLPFKSYSRNHFLQGNLYDVARDDLLDPAYAYEAVRLSLREQGRLEGPLPMFRFKVIKLENGFLIDTNLDLEKINSLAKHKKRKIKTSSLIDSIFVARSDLALASYYEGDLCVGRLTSDLIRLRHKHLMKRIGAGASQQQEFVEVAIADGKAIKEVINSGERSFDEFLLMLDKADKFKKWMAGVECDGKLASEYLKASLAPHWFDNFPAKIFRYVLTAAIGQFDGGLGAALGVADSFYLEKMLAGWRPNHFVDQTLGPFVGGGSQ